MKSAFVIPFARLPRVLEGFDYEIPIPLKESVRQGSIVQIPLRNKKIWGFVEAIRPSRYPSLKSIIAVSDPPRIIRETDRTLMEWFSDYYGVSRATGSLAWAPFFLHPYRSCQTTTSLFNTQQEHKKTTLVRYLCEEDRLAHLVSMIEYAQDRQGQILILIPTIGEVESTAQQLRNFYPDIVCIHSGLTTKVLRERSMNAAQGETQIIIGTRLAVFAPLATLRCIVLDKEERMEYKQYDANPRYDTRDVALSRAKSEGIKIVFSGVAPRLEEIEAKNMFDEKKYERQISCQVIALEEEFRNKNYSFISDALQKKIGETMQRKKTVSLILNRTGYSRMVACKTCQYIFSCERCSTVPRYSSQNAALICSQCDAVRDIPSRCPVCQGHEYTFPGLGIEKILTSIKKIFPDDNESSLTVETSFAFQQRDISNLGLLGFIACDPILSLSDFRSSERQWQSYGQCIEKAASQDAEIILQAIIPSSTFIQSLARLDYDSFAKAELATRKQGGWPPYSRLIKILPKSAHKKNDDSFDKILFAIRSLKENPSMSPYSVMPLSKSKKNKQWTEALIKIHSPYKQGDPLPGPLKEYIKKLPEHMIVDIDPVEL